MDKVKTLKDTIRMGLLPAMATPLHADGFSVDIDRVKPLIDFLIGAGVKGLFVGGTTGEGIILAEEERIKLHESAMEAISRRVPALLHVGANSSAKSVRLARHAQQIGADAIVAVTPYFYPIHDRALLTHFRTIASAAAETPLFVYDIPHMAINGISPDLLTDLFDGLPLFAGLKSSRPDAQAIRRLVDAAPRDIIVLAGNERIALGSLALGVDGLISGLATAVPEPFVSLVAAFERGDMEGARRLQKKINLILDIIPPGARIGSLKTILAQRGLPIGPATPPRPMPEDSWKAWAKIEGIIRT
jgi:dihydrodipicolinate synthase/N-acetylneuraminate lyase